MQMAWGTGDARSRFFPGFGLCLAQGPAEASLGEKLTMEPMEGQRKGLTTREGSRGGVPQTLPISPPALGIRSQSSGLGTTFTS